MSDNRKIQLGVMGLERVDRENDVLRGTKIISLGELKGHGIDADSKTLDMVVELGNAVDGGVKTRFGHPSFFSDTNSLDAFVGVRRDFSRNGDTVRADAFMAKSGNQEHIAKIMSRATEHPETFGSSAYMWGDVVTLRDKDGKLLRNEDGSRKNPVYRPTSLDAVDFVDDPASTIGVFSVPEEDAKGLFVKLGKLLALLGRGQLSASASEGEGELEEEDMDKLTLDVLKEKHAGLVTELLAEAAKKDSADIEALCAQAAEKGQTDERNRIGSILELASKHHFVKTKEHPAGFVAFAIKEGLDDKDLYAGMRALDMKAKELNALAASTAQNKAPVVGAPDSSEFVEGNTDAGADAFERGLGAEVARLNAESKAGK